MGKFGVLRLSVKGVGEWIGPLVFFPVGFTRFDVNEGILGIVGVLKLSVNGGGEGNGRLAFLRNFFGGKFDGLGDGEEEGET